MLFFKIFSDLEEQTELMQDELRVAPLTATEVGGVGRRVKDRKEAKTGDALLEFINSELFPALKNLDLSILNGLPRARANALEGRFEDAINYMKSGTLLRQVINKLDAEIDFNESTTATSSATSMNRFFETCRPLATPASSTPLEQSPSLPSTW